MFIDTPGARPVFSLVLSDLVCSNGQAFVGMVSEDEADVDPPSTKTDILPTLECEPEAVRVEDEIRDKGTDTERVPRAVRGVG